MAKQVLSLLDEVERFPLWADHLLPQIEQGSDGQDLMDVYLGQIAVPYLKETLGMSNFHGGS